MQGNATVTVSGLNPSPSIHLSDSSSLTLSPSSSSASCQLDALQLDGSASATIDCAALLQSLSLASVGASLSLTSASLSVSQSLTWLGGSLRCSSAGRYLAVSEADANATSLFANGWPKRLSGCDLVSRGLVLLNHSAAGSPVDILFDNATWTVANQLQASGSPLLESTSPSSLQISSGTLAISDSLSLLSSSSTFNLQLLSEAHLVILLPAAPAYSALTINGSLSAAGSLRLLASYPDPLKTPWSHAFTFRAFSGSFSSPLLEKYAGPCGNLTGFSSLSISHSSTSLSISLPGHSLSTGAIVGIAFSSFALLATIVALFFGVRYWMRSQSRPYEYSELDDHINLL